ncbi:MAG: protein kinase, partial [Planctomycetaceae bacterium]|nr:protein kinase [Planctomycetaceae bacterium]
MSQPPGENTADVGDEPLLAAIREFCELSDRGERIDRGAFAEARPEVREELLAYFRDLQLVEELAGSKATAETDVTVATMVDKSRVHSGEQVKFPKEGAAGMQTGNVHLETDTAADVPFTPGSETDAQFGRYRILKELGRGGMGAVYLAEDEQLQRKVALKVPRFSGKLDSEIVQRFYREARAAGNLRHVGICPVYDVGEINGRHFISMAYIEGRSLKELVDGTQPQEISHAVDIVQKIAAAMSAAHRQGIIHRDLKSANVMLDHDREPVVMDFGLARRVAGQEAKITQSGVVLGSPAYMSPEQVDGDNDNVGEAADIYALGVILYELLTGQVPFTGSLTSVLKQIACDEPVPVADRRPEVPCAISDFCGKMLAKHPSDRPQSMAAVAAQLKPAGNEAHVASRLPRKRQIALSAAAVMALLSVLAIAGFVISRAPQDALPPINNASETARPIKRVGLNRQRLPEGTVPGQTWDSNTLGMSFCWCPAGGFMMGSPPDEADRSADESQAHVTLRRGFWIGQYEVTQGQWERVMQTTPWRGQLYVQTNAECAATWIIWADAVEFCDKVTQAGREEGWLPDNWRADLPTEAQWEYACRAGTTSMYSFGDEPSRLDEYG